MNTAKLRSVALAAGYSLSSIPLLAHPGHALRDATPQHLLTNPDHLAVLALGGAGLWLAGRFAQRQTPRQLLQRTGLAGILTAAVLWGIRA